MHRYATPPAGSAPSYLWLNDVLAIGGGTIDVEPARLEMRSYECRVELPAELVALEATNTL